MSDRLDAIREKLAAVPEGWVGGWFMASDVAYLLAELDKARAGLAEAWDEGWAARAKRPHLGMHESVPAPSHINPYRTERP